MVDDVPEEFCDGHHVDFVDLEALFESFGSRFFVSKLVSNADKQLVKVLPGWLREELSI